MPTMSIFSIMQNAEYMATIDNVSVKEYLGQEVVPDSGCGSWLFEPQSTNLVTYSEDFSQSFWTKQASVTLDKGYLAPDGTYNATKISGVIGSSYVVSQGGILSSSSTKSIWAKTTSGTGVIHLGANQNQSNASFTVTNEWQRFEVTGTTTDVYAVDFRNASTTLSEVLVWGAQGENLSYATSYIPTNGEANGVTRNQDVCTNGGSLASINSTEGTLYFEGSALANDGTTRIISLSDGTTANRVNLFFDTSNTLRAFITGVPSIATAAVITDNNKVALKFKSGDISVWLNGTEVATSTSTISLSGLSNLSFNQVGSSPFYGKTKALAVWKEALSDEELTELNNNIMNIYKTNFPTEQEGKDYLLSIGVLVETDNEIVFSKDTAAVVYIGKVVKIPATYDADGNIITPAVYYDGYAIDVMSSLDLDFGAFMVYPIEAAHSFYGYPRNAEVPK